MQLIRSHSKDTWTKTFSYNIVRQAKGVGNRIKGNNTIFFIQWLAVPAGKRVTYGMIVVSIRPNKAKTHRVRIADDGKRLSYKWPTTTQCSSLIPTKVLLNSVVLIIIMTIMYANIHEFYCSTPMVNFEHMKLPLICIYA